MRCPPLSLSGYNRLLVHFLFNFLANIFSGLFPYFRFVKRMALSVLKAKVDLSSFLRVERRSSPVGSRVTLWAFSKCLIDTISDFM